MRRFIFLFHPILFSLLIISCGEEGGGGGGNENYIPNKEGSTWTYNCVETQTQPYEQTVLVKGTREVCGKNCQIEETTMTLEPDHISRTFFVDNDKDKWIIYGSEEEDSGKITHYHEFHNGLEYVHYPFNVGNEWNIYSAQGIKPLDCPFLSDEFDSNDIDGDGKDDTMDLTISAKVEGTEDVSVPAGNFTDCYKVRYTYDITFHFTQLGDFHVVYTDDVWTKPYTGTVKWHFVMDMPDPMPDYEITAELKSYYLP